MLLFFVVELQGLILLRAPEALPSLIAFLFYLNQNTFLHLVQITFLYPFFLLLQGLRVLNKIKFQKVGNNFRWQKTVLECT